MSKNITELTTFAHWENTSDNPIEWIGLAQKKDGTWEIGLQTPWEEIATEFEEVCEGDIDEGDRRPFILIDVKAVLEGRQDEEE